MKERPISFSAPMVRALLAGTKTKTRRIVKPQPTTHPGLGCTRILFSNRHGGSVLDTWLEGNADDPAIQSMCPQGMPGDQLWVRETWGVIQAKYSQRWPKGTIAYKADYGLTHGGQEYDLMRWRPSIHMFRRDSRITLKITDVRIERLQELMEGDAIAEGYPGFKVCDDSPHGWYHKLWNEINGPGSYESNPWVWVITFERGTL